MRDSDNLFAAQSHSDRFPSSLSLLPQNELAVSRELCFHFLVHFLVRDARPPHFFLVIREDLTDFFVQPVLDGDFFHHALPQPLRNSVRNLRLNQLPFHQALHHFRSHVSNVIACDQHPRVSPLGESKRKSLLAVETKCKEERHAVAPAFSACV